MLFSFFCFLFTFHNKNGRTSANTKAMKNFSERFYGATKVSWSGGKDNLTHVYFETEGKRSRAAYDKDGQFLYSITTYKEDMLPADIWVMVKERYYRKEIYAVSEVTVLHKTSFLITLEDASSWMQIKITDDEVTEGNLLLKVK